MKNTLFAFICLIAAAGPLWAQKARNMRADNTEVITSTMNVEGKVRIDGTQAVDKRAGLSKYFSKYLWDKGKTAIYPGLNTRKTRATAKPSGASGADLKRKEAEPEKPEERNEKRGEKLRDPGEALYNEKKARRKNDTKKNAAIIDIMRDSDGNNNGVKQLKTGEKSVKELRQAPECEF